MKRFNILILLLAVGAILPMQKAFASHFMGANIEYYCTSACTIEVKLSLYRDCSGASSTTPTPLTFVPSTSGCALPTPIGGWSMATVTEVTPVCPGTPTRCTSPSATINGVEEHYYTRSYDICAAGSCEFTMEWSSCCRNAAITSLVSPSSHSMTIQGATLNTTLLTCNNSPQYTRMPFFYGCAGQSVVVNQGAYDADGDSLSYSLGTCYNNGSTPVSYSTGFSPTQPLGASWTVSINPSNGNLTLTPSPGNVVVGVVCIFVEEWRSGTLIGTYQRDMQVTISNCAPNSAPTFSAITNLTGGATASGSTVFTCGGAFCFDLPAVDANPGDTTEITWDGNIAGATFTNAAGGGATIRGINPTARFCWTPPGPGVYQFLATATDNSCGFVSFNDQFITIVVGSGPGGSASATPTSCATVQFSASGCGGSGSFTYQWSGGGGINANPGNTLASFSHTFSTSGTYPWQVIISSLGTPIDTISGNVTVNLSPTYSLLITPTGPITLCPSQTETLDAGSGYTAYNWSTGATTQTISVNSAGTYSVTVTDAGGCNYMDSVTVNIQSGPVPLPLIWFSTDIMACAGTPGYIQADTSYASWNWSNGGTTSGISVTTPGLYTVTATNALGCTFVDSVIISIDSTPDISGYVSTSMGAPLVGQKVILVKYELAGGGTLTAVDTAITDTAGYYEFCPVTDTLVFVKALPDSATYPGELPTYADSSLFWNTATPFSTFGVPYSVSFSTIAGSNPGGPGFIGGLVSLGANKTNGVGDPVPDLTIVLRDASSGTVIGATKTNVNGYFSFADLPLGDYEVAADWPYVDEINVPVVPLTSSLQRRDSLDFRLHSTYFEWVQATSQMEPTASNIRVFPNPTLGKVTVDFGQPVDGTMEITSLQGQVIYKKTVAGTRTEVDLSSLSIGQGIYFLRMQTQDAIHTQKIIFSH